MIFAVPVASSQVEQPLWANSENHSWALVKNEPDIKLEPEFMDIDHSKIIYPNESMAKDIKYPLSWVQEYECKITEEERHLQNTPGKQGNWKPYIVPVNQSHKVCQITFSMFSYMILLIETHTFK